MSEIVKQYVLAGGPFDGKIIVDRRNEYEFKDNPADNIVRDGHTYVITGAKDDDGREFFRYIGDTRA